MYKVTNGGRMAHKHATRITILPSYFEDGADGFLAWLKGPVFDPSDLRFFRYVLQFGLTYAAADGYCSGCHKRHPVGRESPFNRQHIFPRALCPATGTKPQRSVVAAGNYLQALLSHDTRGALGALLVKYDLVQQVPLRDSAIDIINLDSPHNICLTCAKWNSASDEVVVEEWSKKIRDQVLNGKPPVDFDDFVDWLDARFKVFHRSPLNVDPAGASRLFHAVSLERMVDANAAQMAEWSELLPLLAEGKEASCRDRLRILEPDATELLSLKCSVRAWFEWDLWNMLTLHLSRRLECVLGEVDLGQCRTLADVVEPWLASFVKRLKIVTYVENTADPVILANVSRFRLARRERGAFRKAAWKEGDRTYWHGLVNVFREVIASIDWKLGRLGVNPHTGSAWKSNDELVAYLLPPDAISMAVEQMLARIYGGCLFHGVWTAARVAAYVPFPGRHRFVEAFVISACRQSIATVAQLFCPQSLGKVLRPEIGTTMLARAKSIQLVR